jgi:hypothetical protein
VFTHQLDFKHHASSLAKLPTFRTQVTITLLGVIAGLVGLKVHAESDTPSFNQRFVERDVKQLLEQRCIVCHGCYDAPCQLKMESFEGLARGASKARVYEGERLREAPLTRLYQDADTLEAWRSKGFYSVLDATQNDPTTSVFARMLELKRANPLPTHGRLPDSFDFSLARDQQCPKPDEFDDFAEGYPLWGMPYGLPGLSDKEHSVLTRWIEQGAPYLSAKPTPAKLRPFVDLWEEFLNQDDLKRQLMARYLYEHLYLANLYFQDDGQKSHYFKLVRSSTPPGTPIKRIATRRPFDDPKTERVYYRLWHNPDSVLSKTHMPYRLDAKRLADWKRWFVEPDFEVTTLPDYLPEHASNPFLTFQAIPPESRYRFLLSEAEFTIMNYIKGNVCRGAVALNVIQDRFWVFFAAPGQFSTPESSAFLADQMAHLSMPAGSESDFLSIAHWLDYAEGQKEYLHAKAAFLGEKSDQLTETGVGIVWNGDQSNPNAALTVFRHHDSASVSKGLVGTSPKTVWLIDYPILERIHYLLVAGFDVYGSVSHQAMTRMYMDFLRMESEMNYLSMLPEEVRDEKVRFWYRDALDDIEPYLNVLKHAGVPALVKTRGPDHTFALEASLRSHLADAITNPFDLGKSPLTDETKQWLKRLFNLKGTPATLLPESVLILVETNQGNDTVLSLTSDSAYFNISSMFDEDDRRARNEDKITVGHGIISPYPDAIFHIKEADIPDFVESLSNVIDEAQYSRLLDRFGVRRNAPEFWSISDRIHAWYAKDQPLTSGLLDYNRLDNR